MLELNKLKKVQNNINNLLHTNQTIIKITN